MNLLKLKKEIRDIERLEKIIFVLGEEGFHYLVHKIDLGHLLKHKEALSKEELSEPERIRKLFEKLGPTFVKLGQLLSLRSDLVPHEYCDEFKKLQDHVAEFSYDKVEKIIEKELGKPISKLFKSFSKKPMSAASIGQVHKATLHTGEKVVVKVQRPKIRNVMEADIDIMEYFANLLEKHDEFKSLKPTLIVDEFKEYTERELDFKYELRNINKFHDYFKKWKKIGIPRPYVDYSTSKVLVLEYIDGIVLNEIEKVKEKGHNLKKLGYNGFEAIFYQIFDLGLVHGDPHPANLIVDDKGKIYFIDFGIVGFITPELQNNVLKFIIPQ